MKALLVALVLVVVASCLYRDEALYPIPPLPPTAEEPAAEVRIARAVEAVEELDSLRAQLAASLTAGGAVDEETFRTVCQPVATRAQRIARESGWAVEQLAERYRNPAHRPDPQAREVLAWMTDRPELVGLWLRTTRDSNPGVRYFRRISVRPACLTCHGPKEARPRFVVERYPDDHAYDFRVGDLRGVFAVFVPDSVDRNGRMPASGMGAQSP